MVGANLGPLHEDDPEWLGPYRLHARLATGGMGRIYLGHAGGDGPTAAVKTLLAEGEIGVTDRRRFAREVKVAQRVSSSHTARVLDADPDAERPWMATEYIAAPSLAQLVAQAGVLRGPAARWVVRGTVEALAALHREGIVHRDVKPQNLLLRHSGPCLIDFGISHAADLTRTQLTLGTIAFTSPEQARGERSTSASDIYSLGATLFHLVAGRPPYPEGEEMLRLLARVAEADVDLSGLPEELGPVVRACLAQAPADRPEAAEFIDRFTLDLAGMPTSTEPGGWLPQPWTDLIDEYARQGRELASARWTSRSEETATYVDAVDVTKPGDRQGEEATEGRVARTVVTVVRVLMGTLLAVIVGGGAYAYFTYKESRKPDATDNAFAAVRAGDCLGNYVTPDGEWDSEQPRTADCGAADVDWTVASVVQGSSKGCKGYTVPWLRSKNGVVTTVLCLERRFVVGECVETERVYARRSCDAQAPRNGDRALLRIAALIPKGSRCGEETAVQYVVGAVVLCLTRV
ncbi:serine/threonine-protein kinase [Streptomyces sp. NPDC052299]|uniref:serine/threonine-protein kinase n=1 Tax=Streptomyces sp. NPDC052299 TaxID=3155054 RepID=UPI00341B5E5F